MTANEIMTAAWNDEPLEQQTPAAKLLWLQIRELRAEFQSGIITKDGATKRKQEFLAEYNRNTTAEHFNAARIETLQRIYRNYETFSRTYKIERDEMHSPAECQISLDAIVKVLDGILFNLEEGMVENDRQSEAVDG